jgi:hypothetical protein
MMLTNKKEPTYVSEQGHWYRMDGSPSYTTTAKNGEERAYTLRDAKKDKDRVPSVTTVLKVAANEGLNKWIKSNLLMAAATLPRIEGESSDDWIKRVEEDAREQSQNAAALGTSIHASLEKWYVDEPFPDEHQPYVYSVASAVEDHFGVQNWSAERSFAHPVGFGGKLDLSSDEIVIDFKTSAFDETKKDSEFGYDEHLMQLAAYAYGLGIKEPRCANVYISTTVPGLVKIKEWSKEDIHRGLAMFLSLLQYWQVKNKYVPATCTQEAS